MVPRSHMSLIPKRHLDRFRRFGTVHPHPARRPALEGAGSGLKQEQVRVQHRTSAVNATLLAFAAERRPCSNRSISRVRAAHGSKPAVAAECGGRQDRRTDGRTDGQTDARSVHRPCHAYYSGSVAKLSGRQLNFNRSNARCTQARKTTHARPGWTTSRRGQDSRWKSQSEWQTHTRLTALFPGLPG